MLPTADRNTAGSAVRTSTSRAMPRSRRRAAVTGPTPHNASTGSFCRNDSTRSGAITVSPSGFRHADAIFARNLLGATPADAVSFVSSRMSALIRVATFIPSGSCHAFSVTSRYASSSDNGSTSGVTDRKMAKTCCDAARYFWNCGGTMTRSGQRRTARAIGIAERTPNARAS
jgi:hypothetical protein